MDIVGGKRIVIPESIDIIRNFEYLAIEIHYGFPVNLFLKWKIWDLDSVALK